MLDGEFFVDDQQRVRLYGVPAPILGEHLGTHHHTTLGAAFRFDAADSTFADEPPPVQ